MRVFARRNVTHRRRLARPPGGALPPRAVITNEIGQMKLARPGTLGARGTILGGDFLVAEIYIRHRRAPALDESTCNHQRRIQRISKANTAIRAATIRHQRSRPSREIGASNGGRNRA